MSCFAKGMLGAFVFLLATALAALVILPFYSDYRSRAAASEWLMSVGSVKIDIADNAMRLNSVLNSGVGVKTPINFPADPKVEITRDGVILIHGKGYGQLFALIPERSGQFIKWTCLGGSAKDVPAECRAR